MVCMCVCQLMCAWVCMCVCVGEVSCRLLASRDTSEAAISRATHKVFNSIWVQRGQHTGQLELCKWVVERGVACCKWGHSSQNFTLLPWLLNLCANFECVCLFVWAAVSVWAWVGASICVCVCLCVYLCLCANYAILTHKFHDSTRGYLLSCHNLTDYARLSN